ncbi:acireductone synthase [Pinirhizobacter sp.]|jgi:enolase-phosphatase E1|uniref:acireductone synthase n=1 Tax=Pinirhizobacter sp. TaxID=2950432 RepID=UPI002F4213BF
MSAIRAIVTDIEGTTSSIDFVHDTLFPYARERLPAYVQMHADTAPVQHWLAEAAREAGMVQASRHEVVDLLLRWIDEDRKSTALKALQGMIWKDGYEAGDYRAHVYPEVPAVLASWHAAGIPLYVYSSGSVPAQKLFFRYSQAGDLSPLFSGYFDTTTGPKREAASYTSIAQAIGETPSSILFLSDIEQELDAAHTAGLQTGWLLRKDPKPAQAAHRAFARFDEIVV